MLARMICVKCRAPRETFVEIRPAHYQYAPCEKCGAIGIARAAEALLPIKTMKVKKRQNRGFYENSRYRGQKLVKNAKQ